MMGGLMSMSDSSSDGEQPRQHKELWLITKKEKSSTKESRDSDDRNRNRNDLKSGNSSTSTITRVTANTNGGNTNEGEASVSVSTPGTGEEFVRGNTPGINTISSKKISSLQELKEAISWLEQEASSSSSSSPSSSSSAKGGDSPTADENLLAHLTTKQFQPPTLSDLNTNMNMNMNMNINTNMPYHSANNNRDNNHSTRTSLAATHAGTYVFLDEVKRFELFRSVIQHEDDLLNQRVSWIILAQSFLMAAFITSSGSASDDGHGDGDGNGLGYSAGGYSLKYITAVVGLLTVVVTMPAILAAGRNIELQQHVYFAHISTEERCRELHGHGRDLNDANRNRKEEYRDRMRGGHIFPNMAFRGRGSVPIIYTVVGLAVVQVAGWCFLLIALIMDW